MQHPVTKGKPLEWISTKKLFHRAMQELFIEGVVHDIPDARLAARRWICDVALQKPELMWRYLVSDQDVETKLKQAQIDAILTKTAQEAELHEKKAQALALDIALKEKELADNKADQSYEDLIAQLMEERKKTRAKLNAKTNAQADD